jgi:hypothetical protein
MLPFFGRPDGPARALPTRFKLGRYRKGWSKGIQ